MTRARPLRFLALVLGLWFGARAVMLAMPGAPARADAPGAIAATAPIRPAPALPPSLAAPQPVAFGASFSSPSIREPPYMTVLARAAPRGAFAPIAGSFEAAPDALLGPVWQANPPPASPAAGPGMPRPSLAPAGAPPALTPASGSRWSGSAWLLLRDGRGQAALAPGGILGGSQAGARLLYRLDGGFSLSGRVYAPLRRTGGAEAAAGIDWQPSPRVPVHILAERRQDVGGSGRSAFALTVYGGASGRLPGGLRGEAFAQAGVVGTRSRDLFVDATARLSVPAGRVEAGGSAWAAAQPGTSRLDAGPHISYRPPARGANIRLQADWRFRIAGEAAPGSGPALTIAADF